MLNQYSGILIPIVGMLIPIVAIIGGVYNQAQARRLKADQRMTMIARGVPLSEIEAFLRAGAEQEERPVKDPMRSLANARRAAVVLIATGLGLVAFFMVLEVILNVREVLAGAAAGLIPIAIGIGFWIDYSLQKREMSRFGLELEGDR